MRHTEKRAVLEDQVTGPAERNAYMELRRERRFPVEGFVRVITADDVELEAYLVDCSLHGIRLVSPSKITTGQTIQVQFHFEDKTQFVSYIVRFWRLLWVGGYQIGAELEEEPVDPDAETIIKSLVAKRKEDPVIL
jgi:hypothetical protein